MIEIKSAIENAKNVVITTHKSPDGDAIGSSLALYHYLKNKGINVSVIVPDAFPSFLNWMDGVGEILYYDSEKSEVEKLLNEANLVFSLDYNALNRIGPLGDFINTLNTTKIVIDHHQDPNDFADHYFVDTDCCSTAQLVFELIEQFGELDQLNKAIGECIYCGIMTDTGSFRYPSTTSKTHNIIAQLIELGVNGSLVHQKVYDTYTEDKLRLLGYALTEKLKVLNESKAAYISLSAEELKRFNFKKGDTEGLVNYCLSITGIKMAILLTEKEEGVNFSFRSKDEFYVNKIANKYFNGGGHVYAAGGRLEVSLKDAENKVEEVIGLYENELNT